MKTKRKARRGGGRGAEEGGIQVDEAKSVQGESLDSRQRQNRQYNYEQTKQNPQDRPAGRWIFQRPHGMGLLLDFCIIICATIVHGCFIIRITHG